MKKRVTVNLDITVLKAIDKSRGLISRSAFINKVLKNKIK